MIVIVITKYDTDFMRGVAMLNAMRSNKIKD